MLKRWSCMKSGTYLRFENEDGDSFEIRFWNEDLNPVSCEEAEEYLTDE